MGSVGSFARTGVRPEKAFTGNSRAGAAPTETPLQGMSPAQRPFDPRRIKSGGFSGWLTDKILRNPFWIYAFLRRFWPMPVIKGWGAITHYDDVAEALQCDHLIAVPFGHKIEKLNDGPNFLLGMSDCDEYRWLRKATMAAFPPEDNAAVVAKIAAREAESLIEEGNGRIDVISDLITLVPTRICDQYYGVDVPREYEFGQWTIAMSSYMFGDPANDPVLEEMALAAGERLRPLVDAAIEKAKDDPNPTPDTVAAKLVREQLEQHSESETRLTDAYIRAILIGMITGFVPTNTMAAGHMIEMLLDRPEWMAQAQAAAHADDDDLLKRCLFEAMRFYPLNPGPFRICAKDVTLARGTKREKTIKKGTQLLVSTQSAMFDPRVVDDPMTYDPSRKPTDYMVMGYGMHWCIGAPLAYAQITQTLKPLLRRKNLRRAPGEAGKLKKFGPFPSDLDVLYDS